MKKISVALIVGLICINTVYSQQLSQNRIESVIIKTSNDSSIFAQNQFRLNEDIRQHLFNINFAETDTVELSKNRLKKGFTGCLLGGTIGVFAGSFIAHQKGHNSWDYGIGLLYGRLGGCLIGGIIGFLIGYY